MAHTAIATSAPKSIVRRFFNGIGKGIVASMEANSRMRAVRQLQMKSDAELADIGLRRDDIVRHVYGGLFYC